MWLSVWLKDNICLFKRVKNANKKPIATTVAGLAHKVQQNIVTKDTHGWTFQV